jgi:hypothetical protein
MLTFGQAVASIWRKSGTELLPELRPTCVRPANCLEIRAKPDSAKISRRRRLSGLPELANFYQIPEITYNFHLKPR